MVHLDADALTCDFAEYYHIYYWRDLPLSLAAVLACGLSNDSRIKRRMADLPCTIDTMLSSIIADRIGTLAWMQSKDGQDGINRPVSIFETLFGGDSSANGNNQSFDTGADFEKARAEITGS